MFIIWFMAKRRWKSFNPKFRGASLIQFFLDINDVESPLSMVANSRPPVVKITFASDHWQQTFGKRTDPRIRFERFQSKVLFKKTS